MKDRLFDLLMPIVMPMVPKSELSHWVGRLVHRPLPEPLARKTVKWFASYYQINLQEAEFPIEHYRTIGELFTRKLKAGIRPIGRGFAVHPADSQITEAGVVEQLTLIQAKGRDYKVPEFLRSSTFSQAFEGGAFATYYLCPTDYHRVHSPVDGEVIWSCHVPGELWPVNEWSVNAVPQLFSVNERVVVMIQTARGKVALVMVAATNVGNMTIAFDPQISTRVRPAERRVREKTYSPPIALKKGDEVGVFHMGSTVVMLYEKGVLDVEPDLLRRRHVKMGQDVAT